MTQNIHIGSIIRKVLDESGISYKEFARSINCERQSLYYLFSCNSIDIDRLIQISKVLDYDFIRNVYLAGDRQIVANESKTYIVDLSDVDLTGYDRIVVKLKKEEPPHRDDDDSDGTAQ